MKKLNNKGVTLVELIVSFALVGVAIIYFFQTLYTVKKVYADARNETNNYINRDYTLRILSTYLDEQGALPNDINICRMYNLNCIEATFDKYYYNGSKSENEAQLVDNSYGKYYRIKIKDKIYTEFECECLYMDFLKYYDDPENDLSEDERKYQKSLDGTGVTREEYNEVLKKIEKINNNF